MQRYEYKVIPAPKRGEKLRGVKTTEDRFAQTLTQLINSLGAEGWEYLRADTLPCDERAGLTGTRTTYQNMLVFRRTLAENAVTEVPPALSTLRATQEPELPTLKLGAAHVRPGPSPAIGPAKADPAQSDPAKSGIAAE